MCDYIGEIISIIPAFDSFMAVRDISINIILYYFIFNIKYELVFAWP